MWVWALGAGRGRLVLISCTYVGGGRGEEGGGPKTGGMWEVGP